MSDRTKSTKKSQDGERQFLTPPEIARRLGCGHEKVLGWIRRNQLPAYNLNEDGQPESRPRWTVAIEDLEAFLATRRNQSNGGETNQKPKSRKRVAKVEQIV